jgi:uncharacterized protein YceK
MRILLILTCVALAISGCSRLGRSTTLYDGQYYSAKARNTGDDKHDFTVTVRPVSNGLEGARQAGHHEGTKYCIRQYGVSSIDWTVGPDTPDTQLAFDDSTLTFVGRCVE